MATIYSDQHKPLKELLSMAGKGEDATLLIPNLQRPYIWDPSQVVVLVDSVHVNKFETPGSIIY